MILEVNDVLGTKKLTNPHLDSYNKRSYVSALLASEHVDDTDRVGNCDSGNFTLST
jgi:hypothetical protein